MSKKLFVKFVSVATAGNCPYTVDYQPHREEGIVQ